jgi:hypothetical protein
MNKGIYTFINKYIYVYIGVQEALKLSIKNNNQLIYTE